MKRATPSSSYSYVGSFVLSSVFLLALLLPLILRSVGSDTGRATTTGSARGGPVPANGSIIANGIRVDLGAAVAQAPFRLYRPQDPLASDESLEAVWLSTSPAQIGLQYQSGIRDYVRPSELGDPASFYQTQILQGAPGSIETIRGVVAFIIPQDESEGTPGSVDMVLGGVEVALIGGGDFTVDELRRVAESVT
jgi:hypothetical protein